MDVRLAGRVGGDVDVAPNIFLNVDLKYVALDTPAHVTSGATVLRSDVQIDPLIFGFGVGIRF